MVRGGTCPGTLALWTSPPRAAGSQASTQASNEASRTQEDQEKNKNKENKENMKKQEQRTVVRGGTCLGTLALWTCPPRAAGSQAGRQGVRQAPRGVASRKQQKQGNQEKHEKPENAGKK